MKRERLSAKPVRVFGVTGRSRLGGTALACSLDLGWFQGGLRLVNNLR